MRVALAQINPVIGDFSGNAAKILDAVRKAKSLRAELAVFPELAVCGYPPMDLLDHESFVDCCLKSLREIQRRCPAGIGVVLGYVDRNRAVAGKSLLNIASLIQDGEILFSQAKTLLPTYDVFDEARYFEPARKRAVFPYRGQRLGIAICEDLWWESEPQGTGHYPVDPVQELLDAGATLILCPSASPFHAGKAHLRLELLARVGKSSGVPVVYVNMVGANDSLIFDGRSMVTSPQGRLVFLARGFEEELAVTEAGGGGEEIKLPEDGCAEIEPALILGIRDYVRKCGFTRAHLGLSGGIDSALVAVLAVRALGPEAVRAFALPSRYSSEGSLRDARLLTERLKIELTVLSLEETYNSSLSTLAPLFRDRPEDITEENLQARLRGVLLMAFANKARSLLLATGNKSEIATGYCTLYGDMCGSLAVIGDLFKTEVYSLAEWINRDGELIPRSILEKAPSAELKPDQTDQDTLPPYELLDRILKLYLLQNLTLEQITEKGYEAELVRLILTMVGRAEYKRRQAAPVLKVSPRAFGMGRRIPIARTIYEA